MKQPTFQDKELQEAPKTLKNNKAAGPYNTRGELCKILDDSQIFINALTNSFNKTLTDGQTPRNCKYSKTVMCEKKIKPTVSDLRLISLMNIYKLFMAIIRTKIDQPIRMHKQNDELQAGFTKKRRIGDNLFLLNHCIKNPSR